MNPAEHIGKRNPKKYSNLGRQRGTESRIFDEIIKSEKFLNQNKGWR